MAPIRRSIARSSQQANPSSDAAAPNHTYGQLRPGLEVDLRDREITVFLDLAPQRINNHTFGQNDSLRSTTPSDSAALGTFNIRRFILGPRSQIPAAGERREERTTSSLLSYLRGLDSETPRVVWTPTWAHHHHAAGGSSSSSYNNVPMNTNRDILDLPDDPSTFQERVRAVMGRNNRYFPERLTEEQINERIRKSTYRFARSKLEWNTITCCICQENYSNNDNLGQLDCNHRYHSRCIQSWLKLKNSCPICRQIGLKAP